MIKLFNICFCGFDWKLFFELLLQYIIVLRYPVVLFICLYYFKDNIKKLIDRIKFKKASFKGADIEFENQPIEPVIGSPETFEISISGFSDKGIGSIESENSSDDLTSHEFDVWGDGFKTMYQPNTFDFFKDIVMEKLNLKNDDYDEINKKRVIHFAIAELIDNSFNKLYNLIYGTQIQILEKLNISSPRNVTLIWKQFCKAKKDYPEYYENQAINFSKYISFLIDNKLITKGNHTYSISDIGIDFIRWMGLNLKNENREY